MNVWLSLPFLRPDGLRTLAAAAEEAGVAGLAVSDHPCVPVSISSPYPYNGGKRAQLPPDTQLPDPLVTIAALAGVTRRVRFMTAVLILPLRHPVMLAKEVATVSAMSGGRLDLGIGVGWLREEFEALGNDHFEQRGRVTDEMLPLLPQLWTGRPTAHEGHHFRFDAVAVNPTPAESVPIFVGGTSDAALRRSAEFGDGWVGANHSVEELSVILGRLTEARAKAGTTARPFQIRTGLRGSVTPERTARLRELGVDSFLLAPWQIGERRDSVQDLPVDVIAEALSPLVASITGA